MVEHGIDPDNVQSRQPVGRSLCCSLTFLGCPQAACYLHISVTTEVNKEIGSPPL